jgi:hypothetical protein
MSSSSLSLAASAARTTSGNGAAVVGIADANNAALQLNVTAASGTTPTLDVVVEATVDGTNWYTVGTFTQKVATGLQVITVTNLIGNQLRARWTIGGTTPSFTFTVDALTE